MKNSEVSFTILLPTYNEKENIQIYIPELLKISKAISNTFEILIVDDNSPDQTWKIVQNIAKSETSVKCIHRIGEKGLSSAILTGIIQAKYPLVIVMDADRQHDESIIPQMIQASKEYDLVIGSRKVKGGDYGSMPKIRRMMSKFADKVANLILPIPAQDSMSGFFLIHKDIITNQISILNPKGFKILMEILFKIKDLKILEIGYKFRNRTLGSTKLSSGVIIEYFISLIEMRFNFKIDPTWIKYSLVGLLGIVTNIVFQALSMRFFQGDFIYQNNSDFTIPSIAVLIGFEISLIQNFILNSFWTFPASKSLGKRLFQFIKFEFISILGFIIQISIWGFLLTLYHSLIQNQSLYATYLFNFIGILIAYLFNYFSNIHLTWSKE